MAGYIETLSLPYLNLVIVFDEEGRLNDAETEAAKNILEVCCIGTEV